MHIAITGKPIIPILRISKSPNRIPNSIIPNLNIYLMENLKPSSKRFGKLTIFASKIPNIIASMIDDMGLFEKPSKFTPIKWLDLAPT